jgi:hypothetical protein
MLFMSVCGGGAAARRSSHQAEVHMYMLAVLQPDLALRDVRLLDHLFYNSAEKRLPSTCAAGT